MSVSLEQVTTFQVVTVETLSGVDGQGRPTYAASYEVQARVVRQDAVVRLPNGQEIQTIATIWIPPTVGGVSQTLPNVDARLTCTDGLVGIIVERVDGRALDGTLNHIRVRIREE